MTSYLEVEVDGIVYPLKFGGFEGRPKEGRIPVGKYTESEIKAGSKSLKRDVLAASILDVKGAYVIFIPKSVASKVSDKKTLNVVLPDGSKMKIKVKKYTKMGNKGALRGWLDGKPFNSMDNAEIGEMIVAGSGRVGLDFSDVERESVSLARQKERFGEYTLARTPRKREGSRKPTVRGASSEVVIPDIEARRRRPGETKRSRKKVLEDGTVLVWVPKKVYDVRKLRKKIKPTRYEVKALSWINKEGEFYQREKQVIERKGYIYDREAQTITVKGHWRKVGKEIYGGK